MESGGWPEDDFRLGVWPGGRRSLGGFIRLTSFLGYFGYFCQRSPCQSLGKLGMTLETFNSECQNSQRSYRNQTSSECA